MPLSPAASRPISSETITLEEYLSKGLYRPATVQRDYRWRRTHCRTLMDDLELAFLAARREAGDDAAEAGPEPGAAEEAAEYTPDDAPDNAPDNAPGDGIDAALLAPEADAAEALRDAEEEEDEAQDFAPDLPEPGGGDCYLDSVVVQRQPDGTFELYDGLQRTCALTILIAVLRDMIIRDKAVAARLHHLIEDETGRMRLRLMSKANVLVPNIQSRGQTRTFAERFDARFAEGDPDREDGGEVDLETRLAEAVDVFRRRLGRWSVADRVAFAEFLLSRVYITAVTMRTESLAQRAFVTTNDRGLALRQVELLKGLITDICATEADVAQVVQHWAGIQNTLDKAGDLEDFLRIVDFMERREPQRENCLMRLGAYLKLAYGPEKVVAWVNGLARLAVSWRELSWRLERQGPDPIDASIRRLGVFKFGEWRPLALHWYDLYRQRGGAGAGSPDARRRAERQFALLHRRCLVIQILHADNRPTREKIFRLALGQKGWELSRYRHALNPSEGDRQKFLAALTQPLLNPQSRRVLVLWLEAERQGDAFAEDLAEATVEHILPQNPPADSSWRETFPDEELRFVSCHSLGNLAAIGEDDLGTRSFEYKQRTYRRQAERFRTLAEAVAASDWTKQQIDAVRDARVAELIEAMRWPDRPRPTANGVH